MSEEAKTKQSFSSFRRWVLCFNSALGVVALLALLAMVNYLAGGYYKRFQLESQSGMRLQPQTVRILDSLTEDVSVTIFFNPVDEEGYGKDLYSLTTALLREYHNVNKHILVTNLNYVQFQGQAKELLTRHHLTGLNDKDFVLFEGKDGSSKIIYAKSLADYDLAPVLAGQTRVLRYSVFRGELLFTSAIFAVAHPQPLEVYFLQGHGESRPDTVSSEESYSKFGTILKEELNVTNWQSLSLLGTNTVPSDCQLLVIAGPRLTHFLPLEIEKINTYLNQGNRLLLMFDNQAKTGVESVLSRFGVGVSDVNVREQDKNFMLTPDGTEFMAAQLGPHPTVNPIYDEHSSLRFFLPRYFEVKGSSQIPGAAEIKEIAKTSPQAINGQEKRAFPIAIAVEQGGINGVNSPRGGTRIIAVGDSSLFSDPVIDSGAANHVFANLALNWLLDRPEILLSGISPRPIKEYRLMMTQAQIHSMQWLFLGGMPGAVLVVGWLVWLRRRR